MRKPKKKPHKKPRLKVVPTKKKRLTTAEAIEDLGKILRSSLNSQKEALELLASAVSGLSEVMGVDDDDEDDDDELPPRPRPKHLQPVPSPEPSAEASEEPAEEPSEEPSDEPTGTEEH